MAAETHSQSTYKFNVKMTCEGCSGAIDRVLKKTDGLDSHEVSLETQEVIVRTRNVSYEDVLAKIKKTGKEVKSGEIIGGGVQPV
ncbi:copper metallochaperone ATX1 [Sporobolomyces salmoneus]|uniref:copper metallochaperone ATX1 n=1 Tax=Sporobolomyces salmoneus TaxID=183962 RepID=UPI0031778145